MKIAYILLLISLGLTITPLHNTDGDCHTPYEEPTKANECRHTCDHTFCSCKDKCFETCKGKDKHDECVYYCIYDDCLGKHAKCFNECNNLEE